MFANRLSRRYYNTSMPVKRALAVAAACLAAAAIALAVTVAATSAATSAQDPPPSRENVSPLKEWDTDNLAAGSIGAKNYRIPYHNYRGYVDRTPAKPCIRYVYQGSELVRSLYDGSCPSGYSLLTRWCSYSNGNVQAPLLPAGQNTYNSVQGRRVSGDRAYDACPSGGVYNPPSLVVGSRHPQLCVSSGGILSLSRNCGTRATASRLQHAGCQSAVADAFFQTGGTAGAVNDFPVADYGSESEAGRIAATGRRDRGCVEFAEQQDRLQASVAATGHYLALEGDQLVLKANSGRDILNTRITSPRSAAVYGRWDQKGTHYTFAQGKRAGHTSSSWRLGTYIHPVSSSADYQRRVDTRSALRMGTGLASALVHPWNEATGLGSGQGNFACTRTGWIGCVERSTQSPQSGVVYFSITLGDLGTSPQFRIASSLHTSGSGAQHSGRPVHLSAAQDAGGSWCPAKWHPRGQDAAYAIGNSTGRTLSSISNRNSAESRGCSLVPLGCSLHAEVHSAAAQHLRN